MWYYGDYFEGVIIWIIFYQIIRIFRIFHHAPRFLMWYYGDYFEGGLDVDIEKLEKMYPITDRALLIKCGPPDPVCLYSWMEL